MSSSEKPRVLVLGGCGFVGRNLVTYLVENDLCSKLRVADKALPITSCMNDAEISLYKSDSVEFMQGDLNQDAKREKVFTCEEGDFQIVINCAAETKYGQPEETYEEKVLQLSTNLANEAVKHNVEKFIELSTAQVYVSDSKKKSNAEDGKLEPWTMQAQYSLQAEQALQDIEGLPLIILRPSIIYGPGDKQGLMPRCVCGAVYKYLDEKMKFLWASDLRMNTVHVNDVVRAIWFMAEKGDAGDIYNLSDKADTTQQSINDMLEKVFGIKTGFQGKIASNAAKMNMAFTTEYINDKHLRPWSDLLKAAEIGNSPLTPYLDQELLYNKNLFIDGSKIEKAGFEYETPEPTAEILMEAINYYVDMGKFPPL